MLKLFNSWGSRLEKFEPRERGKVGIYGCGLTVYDRAHIGHGRTMALVDILVRLLRVLHGEVIYVRNITDVDDKINARARNEGIAARELTDRLIPLCDSDLLYLNNLRPTHEPRVTDHMGDIVALIERILANGHGYVANGHVFFDIGSYGDYGLLSHADENELLRAVRIEENPNKRRPLDFVLWKPSADGDDESIRFASPWGTGRPGWHIECSAMSHRYLGTDFDLHCGGMDLKFPHHENEIAQSRCAFANSGFARFWFHVGFLMIEGKKMSKSLGNFVTIGELRQRGLGGPALRLALIRNHYRKPLNFTMNLVQESEALLKSLHRNLEAGAEGYPVPEEILNDLCDDLNTPRVIATLSGFSKNGEKDKLRGAMEFLGIFDDNLLASASSPEESPARPEIERLIALRNTARAEKNWARADEIRDELEAQGIVLRDGENGTSWEILKK
ncbi:MAG: cysteine--tRNA ligase [Rickettsiales bacterium]|jgi:cysteinyl-tRNA synthetase|nr:cysteine--tRNA ligase [Rickettsiales bacterium]